MTLRSRHQLLATMLLTASCCASAIADTPTEVLDPRWATSLEPVVDIEAGWHDPPAMSRVRCWWWWLNGNVTKEAITRDLEQMKAKGFGGANIIDAGGADQRGNRQVPHGPDFASPAWRELFLHALKEADRLGFELGLNIQSGWNLGGPTVRPEQAAKKLAWAATMIAGGSPVRLQLPQPAVVDGFYRDVAVLAVRLSPGVEEDGGFEVSAEHSQADHPPALSVDGDPNTFWVSGTREAKEGPSVERPVRLEFMFAKPTTLSQIMILPRDDYGPKRGWVQSAASPHNWHVLGRWSADATGKTVINFPRTTASRFRLVIVDAYDPRSPVMPRNVQIAEVELRNDRDVLQASAAKLARVDNFEQKAYYDYPGPFTAPNAEHLLRGVGGQPGERFIQPNQIVDVSEHVDAQGRLTWDVPPGSWKILRFGYTLSGSRVSTSSAGWQGYAIDYLDRAAFDTYWQDVVQPLLDEARPYVGRTLRYLHTDSWELGPINWTPSLPTDFAERRGYDMTQYLPVLAGYVVENRDVSNRFLNDFRRTLAEGIVAGKYGTFREYAHKNGLGLHPESGGPHAAPIDALLCLSRSDIAMGEFWARSPTHRTHDYERFFTKQPSSAAHVYGKRLVMAESFTSIGPQWEQSPRDLKPVFDQAACEGLNLVMLHTFDCSPESMGRPGQAYFAGTHINPNVTWWRDADAFFGYLDRCQFMLQQGLPVADTLYFYGENVPSFVRLKAEDPAHVLPGYDYDVINRDALLTRASVRDGRVVLPDGMSYQVLVLPDGDCYSLAVLKKIESLVAAGATVVGPKPGGPIGLSNDPDDEIEFRELVDRLWQSNPHGGDRVVRDVPAREALGVAQVGPDFSAGGADQTPGGIDYVHRHSSLGEVYFVANGSDKWKTIDASFRVERKQPELWDPVDGKIRDAQAFRQRDGRTNLPLRLAPGESMFVVFRRDIPRSTQGPRDSNEPDISPAIKLEQPWQVEFDPHWGGPKTPQTFNTLESWSETTDPQIKYFSGTAVYRTTFDVKELPAANTGARSWLDLGEVKNVASVRLNGSRLGIVWTDPFRVEVTGHLRSEGNQLEIEVTNLWPNRLIGDERLPLDQRITKTNITKFHGDSPLLASGLLGPVEVLIESVPAEK
jgi:(4-O-methyl)-D-glucuronate---lignin esterase